MQTIHELIEKLCPNGVEYKNIQELCKISRGKVMSKDFIKANAGEYPVYSSQTENNGELGKISTYDFDGEYLTWTTDGANAGSVFYRKGKFSITNVCGLLEIKCKVMIPKFLYYVLSIEAPEYVNAGMGNPKLMSNVMAKIRVAVPPLEVQCEIVHILDDFTLLSAELSAELKARQKQYQFYLNNLLDIEKLKPQKIMYVKDLFEIKNGLNKEKGAFGKGTPIVNFTDVYKNRYLTKNMLKGKVTLNEGEIKRYAVEKGDVFFTRTSETKEDIGMSSTVIEDIEKCTFRGFVLRARPTTDLLIPKFCAYYFSTNKVRDTIIRYASFTTRATTSGPKLAKIPVPIISIKEQEKIVNILDRFDKLCNDILEGLPAEIEARQKQYEYYRDKLLTFKELKVNE